MFGDAPFALVPPASSATTPFTYTSDNRAVATIAGNTVTIIGAGTSKITATQLKDNFPITLNTAILTVLPNAGAGTGGGTGGAVVTAPTITLSALNVSSGTPLPAFGTRTVTVVVNVTGAAANATPAQVSFTASCGTLAPASAAGDATGTATTTTTYSANASTNDGCAGRGVTITANTTGATAISGTISVKPALVANLQFVSTAPRLLYLSGSGTATFSEVTFQVVDTTGVLLANQAVKLSLTSPAADVSLGSARNKTPVTLISGSDGRVTVPVFSGSQPTSTQINAALITRPEVTVNSNALVVTSGIPVQKTASLAVDKLSIEGLYNDGVTANATFSIADRQGNSVPVGTTVNFVSSHGLMIPVSCPATSNGVLGRESTCDGVWGTIDVRDQRTVIIASGNAVLSESGRSISTGAGYVLTDSIGNSMPTGTTIVANRRADSPFTGVAGPAVVSNTIGATAVTILPSKFCSAGDLIDVSIRSPLGIVTTRTLTLTQ